MALAAHAARVEALLSARLRVRRWSIRELVVVGLVLAWARRGDAAPPTPAFDDPEPMISHDGVAQLSWSSGPDPSGARSSELGDYEVRVGERVVYRGRMPSAHLSGMHEGDYAAYVRARDQEGWSPWSEAKLVQVRHHPLPMVYALMGLGLLTFVGTAAVVLRSSRRAA